MSGTLTADDRAAIREIGLEYANAWLIRDAETMLSLWADRAEPAREPDAVDIFVVRDIVATWAQLGTTILHVTNHLVWPDPHDQDRARGRVYCMAQMDRAEGFVDQTILYEDWYVRSVDRWLFDWRRHFLWFGAVREANPLDEAPARWAAREPNQIGAGRLPADLVALGLIEANEQLR
jgi:SnoaL-like domain